MMFNITTPSSPRLSEMRLTLRQLQTDTISLALPGLLIGAFILIAAVSYFIALFYGIAVLFAFIFSTALW